MREDDDESAAAFDGNIDDDPFYSSDDASCTDGEPTAKDSSSSLIKTATDISNIKRHIFIETYHRVQLGLRFIRPKGRTHFQVAEVLPGSEASRRKVKCGDTILTIGALRVDTFDGEVDILRYLDGHRRPVQLTFLPSDVPVLSDGAAAGPRLHVRVNERGHVPPKPLPPNQSGVVAVAGDIASSGPDMPAIVCSYALVGSCSGLPCDIIRCQSAGCDKELHHPCQGDYMKEFLPPPFDFPFGKPPRHLCPQHCREYCDMVSTSVLMSPQATAAAIAAGSSEKYNAIASPNSLASHSLASPGLQSLGSEMADLSFDEDGQCEELHYPLTVRRSYLEAFFKNPEAMDETTWNPVYSDPPPIEFNWEDSSLIHKTFKPRRPKTKYGQRQVPQALIQDVIDPDDDAATDANRLIVINLWRSLPPAEQKNFFNYLRENIFARPTINNDPLPASDYAEEVARRSDETLAPADRPLHIASAADTDDALQELVHRSFSSKHAKKRKDRKLTEPVKSNAQMMDKTTRRQIRRQETATFNVYKATTVAPAAGVTALFNTVTVSRTDAQDPLIAGGRHRKGVGEIGFEKLRGFHYVVTCRNREEAAAVIGEKKLREYSKGNNTCTFNTYDADATSNGSPAKTANGGFYRKQQERRKRPRPKGLSTTKKNAKKASSRARREDGDDGDSATRVLYYEDDEGYNDF